MPGKKQMLSCSSCGWAQKGKKNARRAIERHTNRFHPASGRGVRECFTPPPPTDATEHYSSMEATEMSGADLVFPLCASPTALPPVDLVDWVNAQVPDTFDEVQTVCDDLLPGLGEVPPNIVCWPELDDGTLVGFLCSLGDSAPRVTHVGRPSTPVAGPTMVEPAPSSLPDLNEDELIEATVWAARLEERPGWGEFVELIERRHPACSTALARRIYERCFPPVASPRVDDPYFDESDPEDDSTPVALGAVAHDGLCWSLYQAPTPSRASVGTPLFDENETASACSSPEGRSSSASMDPMTGDSQPEHPFDLDEEGTLLSSQNVSVHNRWVAPIRIDFGDEASSPNGTDRAPSRAPSPPPSTSADVDRMDEALAVESSRCIGTPRTPSTFGETTTSDEADESGSEAPSSSERLPVEVITISDSDDEARKN